MSKATKVLVLSALLLGVWLVGAASTSAGSTSFINDFAAFQAATDALNDIDFETLTLQQTFDQLGNARKHGASQDQQLSVTKMHRKFINDRSERLWVGIEVLVDGCADYDDHRVHIRDDRRICGGLEHLHVEDVSQFFFGSVFSERKCSPVHGADRVLIDVDQQCSKPNMRESNAEWKAHVTAATHDR